MSNLLLLNKFIKTLKEIVVWTVAHMMMAIVGCWGVQAQSVNDQFGPGNQTSNPAPNNCSTANNKLTLN